MSTLEEKQQEIIDNFSLLDGDVEMSNIYLMERGQKLKPLDEAFRTDDHIVKGCQSKVWLYAKEVNGKIIFEADSNTAITKGLVSLLIEMFSNEKPDVIINADLSFIDKIGLKRFIGTQRSNGLAAMFKQMKIYAVAFKTKIKNSSNGK